MGRSFFLDAGDEKRITIVLYCEFKHSVISQKMYVAHNLCRFIGKSRF